MLDAQADQLGVEAFQRERRLAQRGGAGRGRRREDHVAKGFGARDALDQPAQLGEPAKARALGARHQGGEQHVEARRIDRGMPRMRGRGGVGRRRPGIGEQRDEAHQAAAQPRERVHHVDDQRRAFGIVAAPHRHDSRRQFAMPELIVRPLC